MKRYLQSLRTPRRVLAALLILLTLCGSYARAEDVPALLEPVGVALDTAVAYIGDLERITVYEATLVPHVEALSLPQNGRVGEIHVVIGQQVKAGDVLITLNLDAERNQVEALKDSIAHLEKQASYYETLAQIDLDILALELERLHSQSPADSEAIALKEIDIEETRLNFEFEQTLRENELSVLREKLAELENALNSGCLYAPFDGRIVFLGDLKAGSSINAYSPILYMADDSRLSVSTDTYLSQSSLKNAHSLYALIGANRYELSPAPIDDSEQLSLILSGSTPPTEFLIENPDESLAAGMYAAVCIGSNYLHDVLLIPSNAIFYDETGRYVYVVEDGERIRRSVHVGASTDWLSQIVEGLEEGEVVYVKD